MTVLMPILPAYLTRKIMNQEPRKHPNPKGFAGLLMIVISAVIIIIMFLVWQKYTAMSLRNTIGQQVDQNGNLVPAPEIQSPQGEVDAVRGMVNNLQDKKNKEIQDEMNK
jgi:hypothetical protein